VNGCSSSTEATSKVHFHVPKQPRLRHDSYIQQRSLHKRCLESVLAQKYPTREIIVIDNNSTDGTIDILEQFEDRCTVVYNSENIGFAAAQNQAIGISNGDWVLTLNPDVLLLPNFIQALVDAGEVDPKIGTVCGSCWR
jgi:GT2 family glycosyltransferase